MKAGIILKKYYPVTSLKYLGKKYNKTCKKTIP